MRKLNDRNNPDLPFRYLAGDEIWLPLEADGKTPIRSNGEKELSELSGKSLLLPKDPAFYPNGEGLEWRTRNLVA